ncbi:MAG: hypothetical protein AB7F19_05505 [Candidatus Babeliales bacterium]
MNEVIKELILRGSFEEANYLLISFGEQEIESFLVNLACESQSITAYGFIINNLIQQETIYWHKMAAVLFLAPLSRVIGAYPLGLYHTRRAMALDSNDVGAKSLLLSYHNSPAPTVTKEEAIEVAKEIVITQYNDEFTITDRLNA